MDDGVVALDEEPFDPAEVREDQRLNSVGSSRGLPRRRSSETAPPEAMPSRPAKKSSLNKKESAIGSRGASKKRMPKSAVGPDGVYEADWEEKAVAEGETVVPASAAQASGRTDQDFGGVADTTLDSEPLEDYLDPAGDIGLADDAIIGAAVRRGESAGKSSQVALESSASRGGSAGPGVARRGDQAMRKASSAGPQPTSEEALASGWLRVKVADAATARSLAKSLTADPALDVRERSIPGGLRLKIVFEAAARAKLMSALEVHTVETRKAVSSKPTGVLEVRIDVRW